MQAQPRQALPELSDSEVKPRSFLTSLMLVLISGGLIILSGRLLYTKFTSVISRDAVINGTLININAPEEGIVTELPVKTGQEIIKDQTVLTLKNDRVSKLQVETINTRINEQQSQLERAQAQLQQQLALLQTLLEDQQNQSRLETFEAQNSVAQIEAEIKGAKSTYLVAQNKYNRSKFLRVEGALAQTQLDDATSELELAKNQVDSLEARLQAIRANEQAAKLGLSLSRSRSNYDPRIRLQEVQLQIADQRKAIQTLQQGIKDAKAELIQAKVDTDRKEKAVVKVPTSGVVWRLSAQPGQFVQQGTSLGQVLDCKRRWVDVFVDEQAVRSIHPGTPATIELYGLDSQVLQGRVTMIRSGMGRLAAGEDVAVPITPNLPRNSQVRVDLDPGTDKGNPNLLCYVGYTGRVTFKVK
ncbi:MAG TPA: HlyD family secretion protein [Cyanobacteria bacterium UBA8553]|nr:HlyD family secretion protein [Cyanobacteria bacterium UBA8553]HAJ62877.1 HlyD family secretion protein [Cyanobacteria bacterium UBA8543]